MGWSGNARRGKYNAKKTVADGVTFASQKEARRYVELRLLERAGQIAELVLQPRFPICIHEVYVCTYVADFQYAVRERDGTLRQVVEDAKGVKTAVYRLKKKLVKAIYNVDVAEV